MKAFVKRISVVFMALLLTVTMIPAAAEAAVSAPSSTTVYRTTKTGTSSVSIYVSGLTSKQSIAKSSVKSSKSSVAAPYSVTNSSSTSKTQYWNGSKDYSSSSRYGSISLTAKKAGTSTVSYKIGSKTYKTKLTVKNYVNPVKSLTVSGISGNLASKFKSYSWANAKIASSKSNGTVKVTAASGWKITSVDLYNSKTGISRSVSAYGAPVSSATLYTGSMKKGTAGYVSVSLRNTKNGGTLYLNLNLD